MPRDPQEPFYRPIPKNYLTEQELDKLIGVVEIQVYGGYTKRGQHRKEVIEDQYKIKVEVPEGFNQGHIKLAVNRHIRTKMGGIRGRTYYQDKEVKPKKLEHKRRVRDFISERGLRENERAKRDYQRQMEKRRAEADALAAGNPAPFSDDTEYGSDGLPKFSEKTYIAQ